MSQLQLATTVFIQKGSGHLPRLVSARRQLRNLPALLLSLGLCCTVLITTSVDVEAARRRPTPPKKKSRSSVVTTKKTSSKPSTQSSNPTQRIAERQHELMSLQKSIEADRNKIASLREKERSTTKAIAQYRRHSQNIQRYMALLEEEIESLQDKAATAHSASENTAGDLWRLRQRYATLVQNLLKQDAYSSAPTMRSNAWSIDAVAEAEALRRVSNKAKTTFRVLADKRDSLSDASQKLRTKSEMRAVLLAMKDSEQKDLDHTIELTQKALAAIRSDKTQVQAHMNKNQASAAEVSRFIATMVSREAKSSASAKATSKNSTPGTKSKGTMQEAATSAVPANLSIKAKSLPYPVASRKILHAFGTYRNSVTNTMTNNPGIDIATAQGSSVSAVAAGSVSLVHWLPGYGSVVIVDHRNGFRSVYANLSSVNVKQGQSIAALQSVGKSAESIDGEFVHLEFWFQKQRLNPLTYLK